LAERLFAQFRIVFTSRWGFLIMMFCISVWKYQSIGLDIIVLKSFVPPIHSQFIMQFSTSNAWAQVPNHNYLTDLAMAIWPVKWWNLSYSSIIYFSWIVSIEVKLLISIRSEESRMKQSARSVRFLQTRYPRVTRPTVWHWINCLITDLSIRNFLQYSRKIRKVRLNVKHALLAIANVNSNKFHVQSSLSV